MSSDRLPNATEPVPEGVFGRISRRGLIAAASTVVIDTAATGAVTGNVAPGPATLTLPSLSEIFRKAVPANIVMLACQGYASPGDGGLSAWRRIAAPPAHGGFVRDAAGALFELAEAVVHPEMFGARGGDFDDGDAIRQAVTMGVMSARRVEFLQPRYSFSGAIPIPGNVGHFSLVGGALTEMVQLDDDCTIFHFTAGNTHNWTIEGFRFAWKHDQLPAHRRSYAIRFDADASAEGAAGHWNVVIANCLVGNGFRGFGQSDDGDERPKAPVWGATFRNIRASIELRGAVIALRTWGRSGQPNNRIEHLYARCDGMAEPAIILEALETAVLTSIEFNRGRGCQIQVESSSNIMLQAIRFEEVGLEAGDCYIAGYGGLTQLRIDGLSVQSMFIVATARSSGPSGARAVLRLARQARGTLRGFSDVAWRSPRATRLAGQQGAIVVVESATGSSCIIESPGLLSDPALELAKSTKGAGIELATADRYDFLTHARSDNTAMPQVVRRGGRVVMVSETTRDDAPAEISVTLNGAALLRASPSENRPHFPAGALQHKTTQWQVKAGDVLEASKAPAIAGNPAVVSIIVLPD